MDAAEAPCTFSDLDPGACLVHGYYLSDPEHPHYWEFCDDDDCAECQKYDDDGNLRA